MTSERFLNGTAGERGASYLFIKVNVSKTISRVLSGPLHADTIHKIAATHTGLALPEKHCAFDVLIVWTIWFTPLQTEEVYCIWGTVNLIESDVHTIL